MTEVTEEEKPLVLVVDDVARNLQLVGDLLRQSGYRVSAAGSGRQALDMLERFEPDLVLLDIMMPGIDGYGVAEALKSRDSTRNTPIIFLTAKTQPEDIVRGFELGAVDYVTKPFNQAELLARVNTHVSLRRAQQEVIRLEKKNAALATALTANHEINQPLTVLSGHFEMYRNSLDDDRLTEKQQRSLAKMQASIERIRGILEKFMTASGIRFEEYLDETQQVIFEP
jgi:DNA-binding response OmpR family regulator